MMMEKPKPEEQEEKEEEELPVTVDDREAEIERRLAALEVDVDEPEPQLGEETVEPVVQVKEEDPVVPVVPPPVVQEKPVAEPIKPNNKSALLARIMAAQERAKQAQVKQQAAPIVAPTATSSSSMQAETQKMMEALNGLESKKPEPPSFASASTLLEPAMKPAAEAPVKPPPPSFDIFEKQMMAASTTTTNTAAAPIMSTQTAPPPPAFDSIAPNMLQAPSTTMSNADADFLSGFTKPVAPPPQPAAPSFDQIMQQNLMAPPIETHNHTNMMKSQEEEALDFALDENGMELTPEAKQKLMEEQRAIMEHIKQQNISNKASEAAIKADAFANRMTGQGVDGFSASEVEEQRRILQQIEEQKHSSKAQQIDIGNGQNVQLHGEEMTQEAIAKGNAQLVLCLNCNNWMQVVDSATLMYCPICSVVTPVVKQDEIMSQEEMLQMEQDRKLAEMLQNEENAAAGASSGSSEYPGNRRSATLRSGGASNAAEKSWWDTISDAMVSVGITADAPPQQQQQSAATARSSYMPPGSNQRMLHSAVTGEEVDEQHVGLLSSEGGGGGRPSARVAQPQPLFSCVVDSISSTVNEASTYLMGDEEEEVNGVDSSSLLATPNIGREKEGSGRYFALPPQD